MKFLTPQSINCSNRIQIMQYLDLLARWRGLQRSNCQNSQFKDILCFQNLVFLRTPLIRFVRSILRPINLLIFICRNYSLSAVDRAMKTLRATDTRESPWCFSSTAHVPVPKNADLDLCLCASIFPALAFNLKSVNFFKPVRSLYRLLSFHSHRRIITLLPVFWISQLIVLRI